jgi:glycosyltransferase involved in cell wall biosynthesis
MQISWSVVITTRNRAKMLRRAIVSCLEQTSLCELIVVDEASTDETPQIVKEFADVRYFRNSSPLGHSAAANIGIKAASGDWIKPLDDDDWLAPNCIEAFTRALESARARGFSPVVISGGVVNVDEHEAVLSRQRGVAELPVALRSRALLELMMLDQAPIGTPVQVGHSRQAALDAGGWNEHRLFVHQHGDEAELWIELAAKGDAVFIPNEIAYRTHWAGGSQQCILHEERFRSNIFLKDKIAEHLDERTPESIKSYLALHWAIIAAKGERFGPAFRLGCVWARRPASISHLLNRRGLRDARGRLEPIE